MKLPIAIQLKQLGTPIIKYEPLWDLSLPPTEPPSPTPHHLPGRFICTQIIANNAKQFGYNELPVSTNKILCIFLLVGPQCT